MICAKAIKYDITVYVTGIDMSSAFNTIDRSKLLNITKYIVTEDEQRMLRVLLSNTKLHVRVYGAETQSFILNVGSPQGDSISGPFFNVYLEFSLKKVRTKVNELHNSDHTYATTVTEQDSTQDHQYVLHQPTGIPSEATYADDHDDITLDQSRARIYNDIVKNELAKEDLFVNDSKTEHTVIKKGNKVTEKWRTVTKLGSQLGDSEDISRRKQLSCAAMKSVKQLWVRRSLTSQAKRIGLYNSLVKSILSHNLKVCAFTETDQEQLDAFHRRQLRRVLGIFWPHRIRNRNLYKKTGTKPLSVEITQARWSYLGHVLRMDAGAPARQAMAYYFEDETAPKIKGRKRTTIVDTINNDIIRAKTFYISKQVNKPPDRQIPLNINPVHNPIDLHNIQLIATDRLCWKRISEIIVASAYDKIARRHNLEFTS